VTVRVRPVAPEDAAAWLRMRKRLWPEENGSEDCLTDRVAYLEGWYVEPEYRRQGVGRALVEASEQWGRAVGCTEFGSDALIENDVSAAAHAALGFEETAQIRCFKKNL
jgi:aminoglycoside 6'-N-acetyltransferase I